MEKTTTSDRIEATNEAHKRQAEKHKEAFEQKLKAATKEKGLIIVNTGTGKGNQLLHSAWACVYLDMGCD